MLATNRHRRTIWYLKTGGLQRGINHIFLLFYGSTRLTERKIRGMACCDSLSSFPVGSICWLYYCVDFMVSFGWSGVWKLIGFYSKQFYCAMTTIHKLSKMDWCIHEYSVPGKFVFYSSIQWVKLQSTIAWVFITVWTAKAPQGKQPPNLMVAEYITLWKWPVLSAN